MKDSWKNGGQLGYGHALRGEQKRRLKDRGLEALNEN